MSAYLMLFSDTTELTARLSEALEGVCVANRACNDDFDAGTKIEEHANCGDQSVGGHFVVCLQSSC